VTTIVGSEDKFTLKSTLKMVEPLVKYTGNLTCTVQDKTGIISQSVTVLINSECTEIAHLYSTIISALRMFYRLLMPYN
jgi:hypothetical protein